jgi:hypothetical protein
MVGVGHIEQSLHDKVSENNCLPNFDEIWYRNCLQKVVEQVWVL